MKQKSGSAAILLIGLSLTFFAGLSLAALYLGGLELDPVTLCQKNRSISGRTLVVIDQTDPYTADQAKALRTRLQHLTESDLHANEWFSLWVLGDSEEGALRRPFCACSPGASSSWLYSNPTQTKARFDSLFARPLAHLLDTLSTLRHADRSPIAESLQELAELQDFASGSGSRRLIIASDMLQNSPLFSQYPSGRKMAPQTEPRPDLRGVQVEILYIERRREAALQGSAHRRFWREYFLRCGAVAVTFERL